MRKTLGRGADNDHRKPSPLADTNHQKILYITRILYIPVKITPPHVRSHRP